MLSAFAALSRELRKIILSYDNMCHLNNLKVARSPLPLPSDFSHMWLDVKKIIDTLHIQNHKDKLCRELYSPESMKLTNPNTNKRCRELYSPESVKLTNPNTNKQCRELYSPESVKLENPNTNTMCCEQTFAWLSRYKRILNSMLKPTTTFISTEW